ncbi:MAG: 2-polyprenyl-3-methyl-6-methoxy-1,4-benzoquinone monooxygenase [Mariprofundaceae bacterium]
MPDPDFRHYDIIDKLISNIDRTLINIFGKHRESRPNPAEDVDNDTPLRPAETKLAGGFMRVNHAGEMAAQALYQGQSLTARDPNIRARLEQASIEESDHLAWCRKRLDELGTHTSYLDPAWYMGSLAIGITAGIFGDRWNLGFLAETEHQVVRHLEDHLKRLPAGDKKSRKIVSQMREDELGHATLAEDLGAAKLPSFVHAAMRISARVMTVTAHRI